MVRIFSAASRRLRVWFPGGSYSQVIGGCVSLAGFFPGGSVSPGFGGCVSPEGLFPWLLGL